MLTEYQNELIHREIDGENSAAESAEVRKLVESNPEALALLTSLQSLDSLFGQVPERAPHPRVMQAIHQQVSQHQKVPKQSVSDWIVEQWNGVTNLMGEFMLTKKVLIVATTAVAAIAIIGQAVVGYQPSVFDAGTVGAKEDGISGVQQAGRYKGRTMTEKDVTLSNPEISAIFQNDQIVKLVQSETFREAMRDPAFRQVQSSEAFRVMLASDAYRQIMSSEAYRELLSSDAFRQIMSNDAYRQIMSNDAYRQLTASDAYARLWSSDAYRLLLSNDSYRQLYSNEAYRQVLASSESYRQLTSSEAYRQLKPNHPDRQG